MLPHRHLNHTPPELVVSVIRDKTPSLWPILLAIFVALAFVIGYCCKAQARWEPEAEACEGKFGCDGQFQDRWIYSDEESNIHGSDPFDDVKVDSDEGGWVSAQKRLDVQWIDEEILIYGKVVINGWTIFKLSSGFYLEVSSKYCPEGYEPELNESRDELNCRPVTDVDTGVEQDRVVTHHDLAPPMKEFPELTYQEGFEDGRHKAQVEFNQKFTDILPIRFYKDDLKIFALFMLLCAGIVWAYRRR